MIEIFQTDPGVQEVLPRSYGLILDGIEQGLHVGAQVHVSLGGQAVASYGIGECRPGVPLTPDTLMPWMSAGKPITAVALARLWEEGLLDIDDPVAQHMPGFGYGARREIRLRHILTHTAGLRNIDLE